MIYYDHISRPVFNYYIGEKYRYHDSSTDFTLVAVNGFTFHFTTERNETHWCTDTVFMDLIRVSTRIQVYHEPLQYELFEEEK